jgi:anthranilate phosphoribosyltransferase
VKDRGEGWEQMRDVLRRVAVGPKGSKDLDRDEAREAMTLCLNRSASDIQIATFLIAERLKRETDEENHGFLQALLSASVIARADAPEVVSLCDPHDGFLRAPRFAPVTAAVLAACGLPTALHGAITLPPKNGITARRVLEHMGFNLGIGEGASSVQSAAHRLSTGGIAIVDVEDFCPALANLTEIRVEMAKRPFLATLEKLISPLRGSEKTHVVAGWVHAGYETLLASLMAEIGMTSTLLVKGGEGHVDPKVHATTVTTGYRPGGEAFIEDIEPKCYGTLISEAPNWGEVDIGRVAQAWVEALDPKHRTAPGQIVRLLAGMVLSHTGRATTIMRGVGEAHQQIASGRARAIFERLAV